MFRSKTDAEVIVHLYEEQGAAFVERLHGMFDNSQKLLGQAQIMIPQLVTPPMARPAKDTAEDEGPNKFSGVSRTSKTTAQCRSSIHGNSPRWGA